MNSTTLLKIATAIFAVSFLSIISDTDASIIKPTKAHFQKTKSEKRLVLQDDRELEFIVAVEGKEFYVDPNYKNVSWHEAVAYCSAFNMTIGETPTAQQDQQVYLFVPLFYNYWLGGTDEETPNQWYWRTNKVPFNWTRWGAGQPSTSPTTNCMYFIEDIRIWWSIDCKDHTGEPEEIHVLCEKPGPVRSK